MQLLASVGMERNALQYPDQLSGGQKQRAAIARTLSTDPEIILFDEPTSALDPITVSEVEEVIAGLAKKGCTMMLVTHSMDFAHSVSNRVFYMDQGGIYEDGAPEQIFDNPQKERTRQFIRHLKVLEYSVTSRDFDFIGLNTQIEEFGRKHRVSQRTIYNLQSYIEEMCVQTWDVDYTHLAKIQNLAGTPGVNGGFSIEEIRYTDVVSMDLCCIPEDAEGLTGQITNLTAGRGVLKNQESRLVKRLV